jgi:hypothetical protein
MKNVSLRSGVSFGKPYRPLSGLTSVDIGGLAFGNKSETAVVRPGTGRSRNLGEQVEQSTQAPAFRRGLVDIISIDF